MWEPLISRPESGCCPGTLLKVGVSGRALGTLCSLAEIKTYIFNLRIVNCFTSVTTSAPMLNVRHLCHTTIDETPRAISNAANARSFFMKREQVAWKAPPKQGGTGGKSENGNENGKE